MGDVSGIQSAMSNLGLDVCRVKGLPIEDVMDAGVSQGKVLIQDEGGQFKMVNESPIVILECFGGSLLGVCKDEHSRIVVIGRVVLH